MRKQACSRVSDKASVSTRVWNFRTGAIQLNELLVQRYSRVATCSPRCSGISLSNCWVKRVPSDKREASQHNHQWKHACVTHRWLSNEVPVLEYSNPMLTRVYSLSSLTRYLVDTKPNVAMMVLYIESRTCRRFPLSYTDQFCVFCGRNRSVF